MFVLQFPNSYPGHILPNMYFLVHIISIHKGMSNTGRVRPQLMNQPRGARLVKTKLTQNQVIWFLGQLNHKVLFIKKKKKKNHLENR